jgi:hypothetical protein
MEAVGTALCEFYISQVLLNCRPWATEVISHGFLSKEREESNERPRTASNAVLLCVGRLILAN